MSDNTLLAIGLIGISALGFVYCVLRKRPLGQYVFWGGVLLIGISMLLALDGGDTAVAVILGLLGIGLIVLKICDPGGFFDDARCSMELKYPEYYEGKGKQSQGNGTVTSSSVSYHHAVNDMIADSQKKYYEAKSNLEHIQSQIDSLEQNHSTMSNDQYEQEHQQLEWKLSSAESRLKVCEDCLRIDLSKQND